MKASKKHQLQDLIEKIGQVDKMVKLHSTNPSKFMLEQYKVKKEGKCGKTGTKVIFSPDEEIFSKVEFDRKKVLDHLRQQAFLTKGVNIEIIDYRQKEHFYNAFYFEGGLLAFINYLNRFNHPVQKEPFYHAPSGHFSD